MPRRTFLGVSSVFPRCLHGLSSVFSRYSPGILGRYCPPFGLRLIELNKERGERGDEKQGNNVLRMIPISTRRKNPALEW
jgi:hypothetical protein